MRCPARLIRSRRWDGPRRSVRTPAFSRGCSTPGRPRPTAPTGLPTPRSQPCSGCASMAPIPLRCKGFMSSGCGAKSASATDSRPPRGRLMCGVSGPMGRARPGCSCSKTSSTPPRVTSSSRTTSRGCAAIALAVAGCWCTSPPTGARRAQSPRRPSSACCAGEISPWPCSARCPRESQTRCASPAPRSPPSSLASTRPPTRKNSSTRSFSPTPPRCRWWAGRRGIPPCARG